MNFVDSYWSSNDGLRLHYRDFAGPDDRPAILCLPGLTRNARDFEGVAARLAGQWRVICPDFRGRGESAFAKDAMTYAPGIYAQDIAALIDELNLMRVVLFGTSLGAIVSMLLATTSAERIAGAVLNDVGPVIEPKGLERIRGYVGKSGAWPTWVHAARSLAESNADVYPKFKLHDWLIMAKRLCRLNNSGRVVPDYDKRIADPFRVPGGESGGDMWPVLDALATVPVLILRGALSDLLSDATVKAMCARLPLACAVTIPDVGHAPTLDEPMSIAAIETLLGRVAG